MGITLASFHISGNIPSSKDLFIKIQRGFETVFDTTLSILWLMTSVRVKYFGKILNFEVTAVYFRKRVISNLSKWR